MKLQMKLIFGSIWCLLIGFSALANTSFTYEEQLETSYVNNIHNFWQQGDFNHFFGKNNIRINYVYFTHALINKTTTDKNQRSLVIVPGRAESYIKYQELSFDFYQQGYDIFIIDHRGQGLSERMLTNPHKGYVENFEWYSDDLHYFIKNIVKPNTVKKPYLIAHSMGGLIAARYLQKHTNAIQAAVLSSPMIAINSGMFPNHLAEILIQESEKFNQWLSPTPWYFIGQSDFVFLPFDQNPLTQSEIRYQRLIDLYKNNSEIQLGGVTLHWLTEAFKAKQTVLNHLTTLTTPTLILQTGADSVVDNQAQNEFCQRLHQLHPLSCPTGKPITINNSYHELFFEQDHYREVALTHVIQWFNQH